MDVPSPLVAAARDGSRAALDQLVELSLPVVLRWCLRLAGPRVDPEDAAHEVLLVVMERLSTLQAVDRYPPWLFQITRRVLAGHRRRAWAQRWVPAVLLDLVDPGRDPVTRLLLSERSRRVQAALEDLPPEQREVFVLCELEERPDEEVAALLGVPVGTAKSRLRLARERFRRAARHHGVGPDLIEVEELDAGGAR